MRCTMVLTFGLLVSTAVGGTLPGNYTLGKYIPADVWVYIHGVSNPERAFLEEEWGEVLTALKDSGIVEQLKALAMSNVQGEQKEQVKAALTKVVQLLKGVHWSDLVRHEYAIAQRMNPPGKQDQAGPNHHRDLFPNYFILCRGARQSLDANMDGLVAILQTIASLKDGINLEQVEGKWPYWSLTIKGAPVSIGLFRKDDVIGLVVGQAGVEEVMKMMTDKQGGQSIVDAPRFRTALSRVPSPEDSVAFFDVKDFLTDVRGYVAMGREGEQDSGHTSEPQASVRADSMGKSDAAVDGKADDHPKGKRRSRQKLVDTLIDTFDIIDTIIMTEETDGRRALTHELVTLQEGSKKYPLARLCANQRPFERFDRFVPMEATGFLMSSAIDLGQLYALILDFVENEVPGGARHIAKYKAILGKTGFDPQRDLFSWLGGEFITVTLPPAVVTAMGGSDGFLLVRVKDRELASTKVDAALEKLRNVMASKGQALTIAPAKGIKAEGFKAISHSALMMLGGMRPVVGVWDEWLVVGLSPEAVNKLIQTASGEAPSIVENPRFAAEGLIPEGPVNGASFKDTSNMGRELAAMAGMAGMAGFVISRDPKNAPMRELFGILARLGPVFLKLDFFSSEASITTIDGLETRTERVITYKAAAPKPEPKASTPPAT